LLYQTTVVIVLTKQV